ncbi:TonB-dependent receptor [uncultured Bacteroides sp.]|uniref:SusC/RagA family TonB-linked outer membrane protein n=1 Tax=uncultured Bacteroides sp. TaxID=162156 RepID=UPI002614FCF4|nr:TonB-dependent receptor [uncultured Bacteroides sp.]
MASPDKLSSGKNAVMEVQQQQKKRTITGQVLDAADQSPLIGVNVQVKNAGVGTITDVDGRFTLQATGRDVLVFSYIGYKSQEVEVGDLGVVNVTLSSDNEMLEEVVVVGAGTQKKVSVTGAITNVKGATLKVPTSSLTTSFAGRLAGVISTVSSGAPGEAASFYIRGISTFGGRATPLIMLDDVEISASDLNNIPAETIESFSILKDASATAIYGSRGANGVMLITTKSGKENERTQINVSVENSFNVMTDFPEFVDGATWMELYNEASRTRSTSESWTPRYSQEQIDNTRNHVNPYMYPDVNWEDAIFKHMALSQRANVNVQGGGSKATYYMSIQANHDTGLLNTKKVYSYNNNINNWGYNFQNNITYKLTSSTKVDLRMNAQIRNNHGPNYSTGTLFGMIQTTNPVSFPVTFPAQEGDTHVRFGSAILSGTNVRDNPYAYMLTSYRNYQENTVNTSLKVTQNFDFITKGLSATALIDFKNWSSNSFNRSIEPYYYRIVDGSFDPATGTYELERVGTSGTDYIAESGISRGGDNTFFLQATVNYNRQFGNHNIGGMLLYMQREYKADVLPNRNQGFSGRFTYDYAQRYLAELNFGYNGTERLAKHDRFEFFPAISLGWMISNEPFFEPLTKWVNSFKLRGSYGLVGSDETGSAAGAPHFLYIDQVNVIGSGRPGFTFGESLNITKYGPLMTQYAVLNAGWERVKKLDVGFDATLFKDWSLTFDFFYDKRYNILLHREAWPESLAYYTAKPWSNKGKVDNWGYELSTTYRKQVNKDLAVELRGNFTYTQNKYVDLDEPLYPYVWQTSTGKPLSATYGYIAEGLFQSQEEIDNSPIQNLGSTVMPGDVKYRDVDGNGIINSEDRVMISEYGGTPRIQYGLGLNIDYKGWNFGMFFNGSAKRIIMMSGISPFGQNDNNVMKFIADNYWSEANPNPNAKYPRLGLTGSMTANNTVGSTYWMRNGSFMRFKTLEIGYRINQHARIYFTGDNLLVFSPFKEWDPELASWNSYPFQHTFNIGAQLTF